MARRRITYYVIAFLFFLYKHNVCMCVRTHVCI